MSGQPWGRTGRVSLYEISDGTSYVFVDRRGCAGWVCPPEIHPDGWHAHASVTLRGLCGTTGLPTLDAAVSWVLRRTRPDVWAAERPRVVRIRMTRYLNGRSAWWVTVGPGESRDDDQVAVYWAYSYAAALEWAINFAQAVTR